MRLGRILWTHKKRRKNNDDNDAEDEGDEWG